MMREIATGLWVGSQRDYEATVKGSGWGWILAAKEPWHREALGYAPGKAAPKDDSRYLVARQQTGHGDDILILNMIDAHVSSYIPKLMVDEAITFGRQCAYADKMLGIFCNQGLSRSPTLAMLILAPTLCEEFDIAEDEFRRLYPPYQPAAGVRGFARQHWAEYHGQ